MLTINQEITRLETLLNGGTVEGLKLNDPGIHYDWAIQRIADLRKLQSDRKGGSASNMYSDPLDLLVENIMDLARERPIDDARIYIRDLIYKHERQPAIGRQ